MKMFKFALICAAAMSFAACTCNVCGEKPCVCGQEEVCPDCGENPCVCPEEYVNPINITDGSAADWDALPAAFVATTTHADGAVNAYNPAVFKWWGADGENGWLWDDPENPGNADNGWGAIVPEGTMPIGTAQAVEGGKIEIQLMWELIPANWAEKFTVGFDIQQSWTSCGILPNAADDETGAEVLAEKLEVTFNK